LLINHSFITIYLLDVLLFTMLIQLLLKKLHFYEILGSQLEKE